MLIITADDYGKDKLTTNNILSCGNNRRISSASAMVFMEDSMRAASLAGESDLEIGLHLNFTALFTGSNITDSIRKHHDKIVRYLKLHTLAQILYNPFLADSFGYVFQAQMDEFVRLYGKSPAFINGHHHMHLCTNMTMGKYLLPGSRIRNTFTFKSTEKDLLNLLYRKYLYKWILKKYISTQGFYSIEPIHDIARLQSLIDKSKIEDIEIEVHPEKQEELRFLKSDHFKLLLNGTTTGSFSALRK